MKYIFILLFVLACTSCSNVTNQDKAVASKEYTTPEDLIEYWIFDRNPDDAPFDESHFRKNHRTEIESTLKVNRIDTLSKLYTVFYSYTVGSDIVRNCITLTSLDGKLLLTFPTYIPTYDADDAKKAIELNKTRYDISSDINFKNLSNQMDSWVKDTKQIWWEEGSINRF